jgi:hypothetical protein
MAKLGSLVLIFAAILLFGGGAVRAEDQDYGYWCTDCGRQHGPGESCPKASAPASNQQDEPYDWSQPVFTPSSTTSTMKTFAQSAREYNAEGEVLYSQGKYHEAWQKFFAAAFNDPDTPLYKENREKANDAIKREAEEKKKQQQELAGRIQNAPHHQKIKNVQPFGASVVATSDRKEAPVVAAKPRGLKISAPPMPGDRIIWDLLAEMQQQGGRQIKAEEQRRIFERNNSPFLVNPLWNKEKLAVMVMQAKDADREYVSARKEHVAEADQAIYEEQCKLLAAATLSLYDLRDRSGLKDFTEFDKKWRSDPSFRRQAQAIWDDYEDKSFQIAIRHNERSRERMVGEDKKFYQRHPELKR